MKKLRAIAALLIAVLSLGILSSCSAETTETTVYLTIEAGDDVFYDNKVTVDVANPTVMNVIMEIMIADPDIPIVLNDAQDSIKDIGEYTEHEEEGIAYFWEYSINGVLPDNQTGGKANAQPVKEGDVIVYMYSSYDMTQAAG